MKFLIRTQLLLILIFVSIIHCQNTIIPGGPVSGTWDLAGSPYLVQGDIEIPDDSTLVIEPGVVVEFQGHYELNIQGMLLAIGTESDTIHFTVNDTTGFHNPDTNLGGWEGIKIIDPDTTNDSTKIIYCKLEYGKAVGPVWSLNAGGALTILNFDKVRIENCLFNKNSAGGDTTDIPTGGAIHLAWSDVKLSGNTFSNNRAVSGGAIKCHDSDPVFSNNIFINNYALEGGGIITDGLSNPAFYGDKFFNNTAVNRGGGIICYDSSATFNNVTVSGNFGNWGGGIGVYNSNVKIYNSTISDNGSI